MFQGLDDSPIIVGYELGLKRREIVHSISDVGIRSLRELFPSIRGPRRMYLWCTNYRAYHKCWIAKYGAHNYWKYLSSKPTLRIEWVRSIEDRSCTIYVLSSGFSSWVRSIELDSIDWGARSIVFDPANLKFILIFIESIKNGFDRLTL